MAKYEASHVCWESMFLSIAISDNAAASLFRAIGTFFIRMNCC
jgi:hypothetical protein